MKRICILSVALVLSCSGCSAVKGLWKAVSGAVDKAIEAPTVLTTNTVETVKEAVK